MQPTDEGSSATSGSGTSERAAASDADDNAQVPSATEPPSRIESSTPLLEGGRVVSPDLVSEVTELVTLQDKPYIAAAVFPRPDYEANPWSQWGQGIVLDDGRVLTSIGDHLGVDGNSYLFVYDPVEDTLTRFADVLSALPHETGSWGYGKIHSQMVDAGDGGVFFATYYGTRRDLSFDGSYDGDVLFRLEADTLDLQPVVVPVPGFGVPSLATNGDGLLYGEAVDPLLEGDEYPNGGLFVFDVTTGVVQAFIEDERHAGFRSVLVGPDGTAWYAADDNSLFRLDPNESTAVLSETQLPASLRAVTAPDGEGSVFAVTDDTYDLVAISADGNVRALGQAAGYTTSLAMSPDETAFLYVPGAHGRSRQWNSALISVDVDTGEQSNLVELYDLVLDEFGLALGGTYSVTVDRERGRAHIGFNAGTDDEEPWGEVVFVVVELP
ncbi:MAG: hypothetical protein ACR2QO_02365 [Acidimicrobiales bacterium]